MVSIFPWTHTLAPGSLVEVKIQRQFGRQPFLFLPVYTEPVPGTSYYKEANNARSGDLQDTRQIKIP